MNRAHDHTAGRWPQFLCVLLAAALTAAGCSPATSFRSRSDLARRTGGIKTVGIVTPGIRMFEEQPRFGMNQLVKHDEWAPAAVDAMGKALAAELERQGLKAVAVAEDEAELKEAMALFNAVNFSIQRHAWSDPHGAMVPREPFPEKMQAFDYTLGPLREGLVRSGIDAVWFVQGYNLLPTHGTRLKEGLEVMVAVIGALALVPVPVFTLKKVNLTIALVDRDGNILYTAAVDDQRTGQAVKERPGQPLPPRGELDPPRPAEQEFLENDLRDPLVARHFIKALLAGYRGEGDR